MTNHKLLHVPIKKGTGSPVNPSNVQLTIGAGKRGWVVCERVTILFRFYKGFTSDCMKKSSEPIKLKASVSKGGEIRDTKTLNLSRNIVLLQVFVDVSRFSPCAIN